MDVEKLAQNAVISVKNSSRFSFEKTEEPNIFDLFCLDLNKLKDKLKIDENLIDYFKESKQKLT